MPTAIGDVSYPRQQIVGDILNEDPKDGNGRNSIVSRDYYKVLVNSHRDVNSCDVAMTFTCCICRLQRV